MCLLCKSSLLGTAVGRKGPQLSWELYWPLFRRPAIPVDCVLVLLSWAYLCSCRKITVAKKSHSENANGFTIYTIAVNSTSRGDQEECQRVWHAVYADMHKMVSVTLELFSTCSSRQMRLTVRREPNGESVPDWCQCFGWLWGSFTVAFSGVFLDVCVFISSRLWICVCRCLCSCMRVCEECDPVNFWVCWCAQVWEGYACAEDTLNPTATVCWLSRDFRISHCFSCSSVVLIGLLWGLSKSL